MLALVLVAGVEVNGARAWFRVASFQLQPSEFGKLVLIASLAVYFGNGPRHADRSRACSAPSASPAYRSR